MNVQKFLVALASADLSDAHAKQAEVDARAAQLAEARERGERRRAELHGALSDLRRRSEEGELAAEALMRGDDLATLSIGEDNIRAELETLRAALGHLTVQERELHSSRDEPRMLANESVVLAVGHEIDALTEEARNVLTQLAEIYGRAKLVADAIRISPAVKLELHLRELIESLGTSGLKGTVPQADRELATGLEQSEARRLLRGYVPASSLNS